MKALKASTCVAVTALALSLSFGASRAERTQGRSEFPCAT